MKYIDSLGIYVTKVEDLRDKISDDIYEVVEELAEGKMDEDCIAYEDLKIELDEMDNTIEESRKVVYRQANNLHDLDKKLDELFDYLEDSKRISRSYIKEVLSDINLDTIADMLKLCI